jgi:long-chain acyl-CoA synthetase
VASPLLQNLSAAIDATFEAVDANKPLLVGAEPLTYGIIKDRMGRMQTLFSHYGLGVGDRIVIVSRDDSAVISLYFATVRAGLVAVVGNSETTTVEVARLIAAAEPRMVFVDRAIMPIEAVVALLPENCHAISIDGTPSLRKRSLVSKLLRGNRLDAPLITDRGAFPALLEDVEPSSFAPAPADAAVAHMLFTSGTTSRPKGVEITHGNIRAQLSTFLSVYGYDADSRILNILPLHHTDGLMQGPVVAFIAGATVYRPGRFRVTDLPELMATVRRERITHFIVVPTMLSLMMRLAEEYNDSLKGSDLRVLRSSADLLDPTLWRSFEKRFGVDVTNSYGLTETVCEAIYCGPAPATKRIGTIGKPVDCKARIVDDSGTDVPAGEVGELWISGANIMKGYFRQPEETAAVLTDGWYHTGDLARVDADGFFAIAGRKKTVIITGGTNVHPENITTTIRDLEGVIDAVTFGLKDEVFGEIVVSCVVVAPNSGLDIDAILSHCRSHLSAEKVPATVYLLDDLPRGPAGKILLDDVKVLAAERAPGKIKSTGGIREQVLEIAARTFKVPISTLTSESTPDNTNGWDSLAHISFIAALERQFNLRITASEIMNLRSLADAERIVRRTHADYGDPKPQAAEGVLRVSPSQRAPEIS